MSIGLEIAEIWKEIKFKVMVMHVVKDDNVHNEYMINPQQYMIHKCDSKAREARSQMAQTQHEVTLEGVKTSFTKSVHETIRLMDADKEEKEYIAGKFKEFGRFVDREARRVFRNPTISMIKCLLLWI